MKVSERFSCLKEHITSSFVTFESNVQKKFRHWACLPRAAYTTILLCFGLVLTYRALPYLIEQFVSSNYFKRWTLSLYVLLLYFPIIWGVSEDGENATTWRSEIDLPYSKIFGLLSMFLYFNKYIQLADQWGKFKQTCISRDIYNFTSNQN